MFEKWWLKQLEEIKGLENNSNGVNKSSGEFYSNILSRYPVLIREEEKSLFTDLADGTEYEFLKFNGRRKPVYQVILREPYAEEARQKLIGHNLRLAFKIVSEMTPVSSQCFDDLFQEGTFVLMRAVDTFRPRDGNKFSTYLGSCLKMNLPGKLANLINSSVIHVPRHTNFIKKS